MPQYKSHLDSRRKYRQRMTDEEKEYERQRMKLYNEINTKHREERRLKILGERRKSLRKLLSVEDTESLKFSDVEFVKDIIKRKSSIRK